MKTDATLMDSISSARASRLAVSVKSDGEKYASGDGVVPGRKPLTLIRPNWARSLLEEHIACASGSRN